MPRCGRARGARQDRRPRGRGRRACARRTCCGARPRRSRACGAARAPASARRSGPRLLRRSRRRPMCGQSCRQHRLTGRRIANVLAEMATCRHDGHAACGAAAACRAAGEGMDARRSREPRRHLGEHAVAARGRQAPGEPGAARPADADARHPHRRPRRPARGSARPPRPDAAARPRRRAADARGLARADLQGDLSGCRRGAGTARARRLRVVLRAERARAARAR